MDVLCFCILLVIDMGPVSVGVKEPCYLPSWEVFFGQETEMRLVGHQTDVCLI